MAHLRSADSLLYRCLLLIVFSCNNHAKVFAKASSVLYRGINVTLVPVSAEEPLGQWNPGTLWCAFSFGNVSAELNAFDGQLGRLDVDIDAILSNWCAFSPICRHF